MHCIFTYEGDYVFCIYAIGSDIKYVQEVLPHFRFKLLYEIGQDYLVIQYKENPTQWNVM